MNTESSTKLLLKDIEFTTKVLYEYWSDKILVQCNSAMTDLYFSTVDIFRNELMHKPVLYRNEEYQIAAVSTSAGMLFLDIENYNSFRPDVHWKTLR